MRQRTIDIFSLNDETNKIVDDDLQKKINKFSFIHVEVESNDISLFVSFENKQYSSLNQSE